MKTQSTLILLTSTLLLCTGCPDKNNSNDSSELVVPAQPEGWRPDSDVVDKQGNVVWTKSNNQNQVVKDNTNRSLQQSGCYANCDSMRSSCSMACAYGNSRGSCLSECSNAASTCKTGCRSIY
jgi:hypothetical protein